MRPSLILKTAITLTYPLLVILSFFFFLRGHHAPGGGFIGGLVMAAALGFYSLAWGPAAARARMKLEPPTWLALGLATALLGGLVPVFSGQPFMTGTWTNTPFPGFEQVGTPVLFDLGVYLLVMGMTLQILLLLEENG